jgi:hypothetical protein
MSLKQIGTGLSAVLLTASLLGVGVASAASGDQKPAASTNQKSATGGDTNSAANANAKTAARSEDTRPAARHVRRAAAVRHRRGYAGLYGYAGPAGVRPGYTFNHDAWANGFGGF